MALASQITGSTEILQVAEAVAREKGIKNQCFTKRKKKFKKKG
jgi:hypothetical protein